MLIWYQVTLFSSASSLAPLVLWLLTQLTLLANSVIIFTFSQPFMCQSTVSTWETPKYFTHILMAKYFLSHLSVGWSAPWSDGQSVDNKVNCCIVDADVDTASNKTWQMVVYCPGWPVYYEARSWEFAETFKSCPVIVRVVNWNYSHKIVSREGLSLESIKRMVADVR